MSDFIESLRAKLAAAGLKADAVDTVERQIVSEWAGVRVYIPRIETKRRSKVRELERAGFSLRTAQWKAKT